MRFYVSHEEQEQPQPLTPITAMSTVQASFQNKGINQEPILSFSLLDQRHSLKQRLSNMDISTGSSIKKLHASNSPHQKRRLLSQIKNIFEIKAQQKM